MGETDKNQRSKSLAAQLRIVHKSRHEATGVRVFEVKEPQAPSGFRVRYDSSDTYARKPRRGEITRLVKAFLAKFYRDLDPEIRHETLDLYQIQVVIIGRLGSWLAGLLGMEEDYYIPPCIIAHIMRSLDVDGCYFEVRADTVRLMAREEGEPKASVNIRLADY